MSSEVKEARERVKAAVRNSGIRLAPKKVTINLYPADIRKTGTGFDLPIALAVLAAHGRIPPERLEGILFAGEISLNGEVRAAGGILPMVLAAKEEGKRTVCVPRGNVKEAELVKGMTILPSHVLWLLLPQRTIRPPFQTRAFHHTRLPPPESVRSEFRRRWLSIRYYTKYLPLCWLGIRADTPFEKR